MEGCAMAAAGNRQLQETAVAGLRRGACPTLAAPMQTGDGLLVRLRPAGGALTVAQLKALASAAASCGNGILEITARGNLQVRGLRPDSVGTLALAIDAAGIVVPPGPAIELSPLHGIDSAELGDAAALEAQLRSTLAGKLQSVEIAPKLAILVDGRGGFCLDHLSADIRIVALADYNWLVTVGGTTRMARPVFSGGVDGVVAAVGYILDILIATGRHSRARDIDIETLRTAFRDAPQTISLSPSRAPVPGILALPDGRAVLGLRPRLGQMRADALTAFLADLADELEIRLAPDRQLFLTGLVATDAEALAVRAGSYGFTADPLDPSANIAACAGAGACASGFYDTRKLAARIIDTAPDLLDGSLTVHLSGCAKGCAYPQAALTFAGRGNAYAFSLNGKAGDPPDATIAGGGIESAIERLAQLAGTERRAGETVAACLQRLGASTIAKALQQD